MKRLSFLLLAFVPVLFAVPAVAGVVYQLNDEMRLTLQGDMRLRWENFNSGVISPRGGQSDGQIGYLRLRTRLAGTLELPDGISIQARLVNRIHEVSTHYLSNPNDVETATWKFPDEVFFDKLLIEFKEIAGSDFSLTLGRQDLILGNGMIILEGTPFDQGRSLYQDGAVLRYITDTDKVTLFLLYNQWKDRSAFINDQNRRLRVGDTLTTGVYWTHFVNKLLQFDLYYVFNDVDDEDLNNRISCHPFDNNLSLHTIGGRLFGKAFEEQLEYSLELARQGGLSTLDNADIEAYMLDARIRLNAPSGVFLKPSLGFEYYYASGDNPDTSKNEGWNTLLAEYPRYGDELLPIMLNGVWSNMHFLRTDLNLICSPDFNVNFSVGNLFADQTEKAGTAPLVRSGGGSYMGTLLSLMLDYRLNQYLSFSAKMSKFAPGSYFADGKEGYWCQFQALAEF
ncbi:MAG: alginate export family protein [Lentisphaeria bacterium]